MARGQYYQPLWSIKVSEKTCKAESNGLPMPPKPHVVLQMKIAPTKHLWEEKLARNNSTLAYLYFIFLSAIGRYANVLQAV